MTILLVLVGLMTAAFNSASKAWQLGERQVEQFQQARAALDLLSRDLQQALVSTNIPFYGNTNSLAFVAVNNDDTNAVDLAEVVYRLNWDNYKLWRRYTRSVLPSGVADANWDFYTNVQDWPVTKTSSNLVCDGVVGLSFTYYANDNSSYNFWNSTATVNTWKGEPDHPLALVALAGNALMIDKPPSYIDVRLDVVDSKTAALLPTLSGLALDNVTNTAKRTFNIYVTIPRR